MLKLNRRSRSPRQRIDELTKQMNVMVAKKVGHSTTVDDVYEAPPGHREGGRRRDRQARVGQGLAWSRGSGGLRLYILRRRILIVLYRDVEPSTAILVPQPGQSQIELDALDQYDHSDPAAQASA